VYCTKLCLWGLGFCIANAQLYETLKSDLKRLAALGGNDSNLGVEVGGDFGGFEIVRLGHGLIKSHHPNPVK
jgi:hypothetical protein